MLVTSKSISIEILSYFLLILIFNGSLDFELFHPHGATPMKTPINNMESILELGLELGFEIEDAIPEKGATDEIPNSIKKSSLYIFKKLEISSVNIIPAILPYHFEIVSESKGFITIFSPPPNFS